MKGGMPGEDGRYCRMVVFGKQDGLQASIDHCTSFGIGLPYSIVVMGFESD